MIVLEILEEDLSLLGENKKVLEENGSIRIQSKKFQGAPETVQFLIELSPVVVVTVASIVITYIKSRKHIKIKHNGTEVDGISEKNAVKILNMLFEQDKAAESNTTEKTKKNSKRK